MKIVKKNKACDIFKTRRVLKNYHNNRDKILDKKKNYYNKNKEYLNENNKKRKSNISDLENQMRTLSELIKTTVSVSYL